VNANVLGHAATQPNPSAVHLNDALQYGKLKAGAAFLAGDRILGLLKLLKQLP